MPAVVLLRADLPFPGSLPEFQRLFPDDTACAAYLEAICWRDGFVCGWCGKASEPYRFASRPQVLRCRKCQRDNALTAGTVMERTRTPLCWGSAGRRWPRPMTGCTPVHGNIQNAAGKTRRASSELGYRQTVTKSGVLGCQPDTHACILTLYSKSTRRML